MSDASVYSGSQGSSRRDERNLNNSPEHPLGSPQLQSLKIDERADPNFNIHKGAQSKASSVHQDQNNPLLTEGRGIQHVTYPANYMPSYPSVYPQPIMSQLNPMNMWLYPAAPIAYNYQSNDMQSHLQQSLHPANHTLYNMQTQHHASAVPTINYSPYNLQKQSNRRQPIHSDPNFNYLPYNLQQQSQNVHPAPVAGTAQKQHNIEKSIHDMTPQIINPNDHVQGYHKQDPGNRFDFNCMLTPRDVSELIPEFNPSSRDGISVRRWVAMCERLKSIYNFNEIVLLYAATKKLKGNALIWYQSVSGLIECWDQLRNDIIREFDKIKDVVDIHDQLKNRRKKSSESLTEYVYHIRRIGSEIDLCDETIIKYFFRGLSEFDENIKYALAAQSFNSVSELLVCIKRLESLAPIEACDKSHNEYRGREKSRERYPINPSTSKADSKKRFSCLKCNSPHHSARFCPKGSLCSFCKEPGHFEIECYKKKSSEIRRVEKTCEYIKKVFVNNLPMIAFIDLGSDCVTIIESAVKSLNLKIDPGSQVLKGFGNNLVKSFGKVNLLLEIDHIFFKVDAYVVNDAYQTESIMIGRTVLDQQNVVVVKSFKNLQIFQVPQTDFYLKRDINNNLFTLQPKLLSDNRKFNNNNKLRICKILTIDVPSTQDVNVPVLKFIDNKDKTCSNLLNEEEQSRNQSKSMCINGNECSGFEDKILSLEYSFEVNSDDRNFTELNCRKLESKLNILKMDNVHLQQTDYVEVTDYMIRKCIIDNIDDRYFGKIKKLILKFRKCFALNMKEVGLTNKAEIKIKLKDEVPFSYRPYRLSHAQKESVKRQIDELLELGIISPSNSEYSSPIVIVKKKSGEDRICVDFRKLNSHTIRDRFPLPNIEDSIQRLSNMKYFSVLDLSSGYYQLPVSECSKKYTSFVTPDGQFQFNRMPFGLTNAPSVFQRMMNSLCRDVDDRIISYLDDVILASSSLDDGIELLGKVLRKLEEYGLTLNLSKCRFLNDKVEFLGHEISTLGIRAGQDKINCVKNFPTPKNVHEVRQFIGLCSYFRKFIARFSLIAEPLTNLTRKDLAFKWSIEQDAAFNILKEKLCDRDILTLFDNSKAHEIHTDASCKGLAGVLLQQEEDGLRPVSYFSRKTSTSEEKFHSYELEALAVVESLDKFKSYVMGKPFTVVTDCSALRYASTQRHIIPRIARWWLKILEFDFTIKHRNGKSMQHIDALSRNATDSDREIETASLDIFRIEDGIDDDWISYLQENDSDIQEIKASLNNSPQLDYVIDNGKLCRKFGDKLLYVVPKGMRGRIIYKNHDESGHIGAERTLLKIREYYWWPRMRQFIKKYVNSCTECIFHRENRDAKRIDMHFIEKIPIPCHTWHLDHVGPFIKSNKNNQYILTIVDAFTKYIVLRPVRNTSLRFVVKTLKSLAEFFGMPKRIITDRGSCFTSKDFASFCMKYDIQHILNATATPRANGQVERYHRTLLHSLKTMSDHDQAKWENMCPKIQWTLNSLPQSVTKVSPHELLYGFKLRTLDEDKLTLKLFDEKRGTSKFTTEDRNQLRDEACERIKLNQAKQKKIVDAKLKSPKQYTVGDMVVVHREPVATGESRKLMRKFRGPYKIVRVLYGDRYQIEDFTAVDGRRRFRGVAAADHLRLVEPPPPILDEFDTTSGSEEDED